jgi:hypothetical protein
MSLDLSVNRNNLEADLGSIPNDIKLWADAVVENQLDLMLAEQKLDLTQAQLSLAVRSNPAEYGIAKITEDLVKAVVTVQPGYQAALTEYNTKKNAVNASKAVLDALEVRRSSLKHLTELTISGFLGSTTVNPMPAGVKSRS